ASATNADTRSLVPPSSMRSHVVAKSVGRLGNDETRAKTAPAGGTGRAFAVHSASISGQLAVATTKLARRRSFAASAALALSTPVSSQYASSARRDARTRNVA